jgi:vacuolar-type H+-ATPase subunit H
MAADDGMRDSDAVDRVINQVLEAEEEAREAVEQCRAQAARIVADAQEQVRRIERRTESRIKRAHRIADLAVDRAIRKLGSSESGQVTETPEREAAKMLDRVVDALVDEILG